MKLEQKQLVRNFNAIKEMYSIDVKEEEKIIKVLEQLADITKYTLEKERDTNLDDYKNHKIKAQLKLEREQSMKAKMLHKGTLL